MELCFDRIPTRRLVLRILCMRDKEAFFAYRTLPVVAKYQSWHPLTLMQTEDFIRGNLSVCPDTPNTWLQLAICLPDDRLIGDIGVHFLPDGQAEIGYTLSPAHQGHGYAREAVRAVLDVLFLQMNKHRVSASADPRNVPSIRLLLALGFTVRRHISGKAI